MVTKVSTVDIDPLDRITEAKHLTDFLRNRFERYGDRPGGNSYVLNINSEWGFGKTFLLKKWEVYLRQEKHPVVYFDAWKSDFSDQPFLAFICEFEEQIKPYLSKNKKIEKSINILKTLSEKIVAGYFLERPLGIKLEDIQSGFDKKSSFLEAHNTIKTAIDEFHKELKNLITDIGSLQNMRLPFFVFVDELDRCRPNFAIELLENIKHIFDIDGLFFVVATDTDQLCESIKVLYGHSFQADLYLQRFFNVEYSINDPNNFDFSNYLFNKYKLVEERRFIKVIEADKYISENPDTELFALMSSYFKTSLRNQIRAIEIVEAFSLMWPYKTIHLGFLLLLIMLKMKNDDLFKRFQKGENIFKSNDVGLQKVLYKEFDLDVTFQARQYVQSKSPVIKAFGFQDLFTTYFEMAKKDFPNDFFTEPDYGNSFHRTIFSAIIEDNQNNQLQKNLLNDYYIWVKKLGRI